MMERERERERERETRFMPLSISILNMCRKQQLQMRGLYVYRNNE